MSESQKMASESPKKEKKKKVITEFPLYDKKMCRKYFATAKTILTFENLQTNTDEKEKNIEEIISEKSSNDEESSNQLKCSYCQVAFDDISDQRNHYKQDWHRYNLKRSLESKSAVSENDFVTLIEGKDADTLSISGSDSDSSDEEDNGYLELQRNPKFFFQTSDTGEILSVFKTVLVDPKNKLTQPDDETILKSIDKEECKWAIFMVGGGHFAAAVFRGETAVVHKTFHSYTVRKKQGGSQGAADNRAGATHKSAGASLRRYNELAHIQHIQDITQQWEKELSECTLIFIRASSHSRSTLFGGKTPALKKSDPRLRTVPFPTKRATFSEVKRVYEILSRVQILQNIPNSESVVPKPKRMPSSSIHRSKSRDSRQRELPGAHINTEELETDDLEKNVESLAISQKSEDWSPKKKKNKKKTGGGGGGGKKGSMNADLAQYNSSDDEQNSRFTLEIENQTLTAVRSGNTKLFTQTIQLLQDEYGEQEFSEETRKLLNKSLGDQKLSYLHFAAQGGHSGLIGKLLELGCDPSVKDKAGRVPYSLAKDKETRAAFIKSRSLHPDKYDWKKALVPEPLSQEELQQKENKEKEKKKAKQQMRKEKLKLQKEEQKQKKEEAEEKARYLALSDREKRALAAERRILAASSGENNVAKTVVLNRCFLCGQDITGKVPFTYNDNNFCSIACVKKHRTST
eukprot:TRINITY_DN3748_c0_g1_i11.p1 TRINITY_DN3748_c0_g1~~TRINITY_DN3748_c0_g1_i11.p1  ORF type:complete len:689 (-),score=165.42 TRINITY_DN3748_c0_g1_i11:121-2187(-)